MKALVTGATGFIGGNVVRALLRHDYHVRALVREGSAWRNIAGLPVELCVGDLRDRASLDRAVQGCDCVFHAGAAYTYWTRQPEVVYETNVQGTQNILAAARAAGVQKIVYTSTESTIGIVRADGLGTEETTVDPDHLSGPYKKSKYTAEQFCLEMARTGLPVVVVNPTMPVGPYDVKPTPTGQVIVDYLKGQMPAYVNTGMNLVDVEDVAEGHVLALEKGQTGQRYVLGNRNLTFRELLGLLEQLTGIPAPKVRIPVWLALGAAYANEFIVERVGKGAPRIPVAGVKAAYKVRHFDCSRAIRELGLPQTPVEEALSKAIRWFRENGYAP